MGKERIGNTRIACPNCGGRNVDYATRAEYRHMLIVLHRPVKCTTCGNVFHPPLRRMERTAVVLGGMAVAAAAVMTTAVPAAMRLLGEERSALAIWHLLEGLLVAFAGLAVSYVGLRNGRISRCAERS